MLTERDKQIEEFRVLLSKCTDSIAFMQLMKSANEHGIWLKIDKVDWSDKHNCPTKPLKIGWREFTYCPHVY